MKITLKTAATRAKTGGEDVAPTQLIAMLTVQDVAEILQCSPRTIYRHADSGRMPAPTKIGALVRWPRKTVENWLADGCPNCRKGRSP